MTTGNRVIDRFMKGSPTIGGKCPASYDRYWDLLMPVIAKINTRRYDLRKEPTYNRIHLYCGMADLKGTHEAIVEFLQWDRARLRACILETMELYHAGQLSPPERRSIIARLITDWRRSVA